MDKLHRDSTNHQNQHNTTAIVIENNTSARGRENDDEHLSRFVASSTLHGLSHVCVADSGRPRRLLWLLLLLSMTAAYVTMAVYSFSKYYRYEATTRIDRKAVDTLDFPAVSICHPNVIPQTLVDADPELLHWMERIENDDNLTTNETRQAREKLRQHNMLAASAEQVAHMLYWCEINDGTACLDRFTAKISESTMCLTFQDQQTVNSHGIIESSQPGRRHGLCEYNTRVHVEFTASNVILYDTTCCMYAISIINKVSVKSPA